MSARSLRRSFASGGQAQPRVDGAMVAARQGMHRGFQHGAPGIEEDVIDRENRALSTGPPGGNQSVTRLSGGVDMTEAQQSAELCMIEGGVEVPGQHARGIPWRR